MAAGRGTRACRCNLPIGIISGAAPLGLMMPGLKLALPLHAVASAWITAGTPKRRDRIMFSGAAECAPLHCAGTAHYNDQQANANHQTSPGKTASPATHPVASADALPEIHPGVLTAIGVFVVATRRCLLQRFLAACQELGAALSVAGLLIGLALFVALDEPLSRALPPQECWRLPFVTWGRIEITIDGPIWRSTRTMA